MTSNNANIVFFDLETTGLDMKTDRIIQIGMVKVNKETMEVIDAIEQKVNPCGVKSSQEAIAKHKITDEELLAYPKFVEIADSVLEFLEGCDLAGHNCIHFDIPFLMEEMSKCGRAFTIEKRRIFDTKVMYNHYHQMHLEDIYKQLCPNADLDCESHDAICDTQMCIDIYKAMVKEHTPTEQELDEINGNNTRIDVSGFFVFNESMKVCMGKGKYAGKEIELVDPSYFSWMINQDFPQETINLARRCLNYLSKR